MQKIRDKLAEFHDPFLDTDLVSAKTVKNITDSAESVQLTLQFGFPIQQYQDDLIQALQAHLSDNLCGKKLEIHCETNVAAHQVQSGVASIRQIKNIIAVASGKGGVGKSTVAVNLALALAKEGGRVGLLDADIYGPSQPQMLGCYQRPDAIDGKMKPIERHGIYTMSIGYLIAQDNAVVWRGPMISTALQQLLRDTAWPALDYLVIDLPPGTGDVQLTLAQKIPVSAAVVVTTPQDLALLDVRRAINMFKKVSIPVLGVVENMSYSICQSCGHVEAIFGHGGGDKIAKEFSLPLLGAIPLDKQLHEQTDQGKPTVVAAADSTIAQQFYTIARHVSAKLSLQACDESSKFPNIVIEKS